MRTDTIERPTVCDCGHAPTENSGCGTGYARTGDGQTMCYPCADSAQAAEVAASEPGDRVSLYVSSDGQNVTTWSGGVIMNRVHLGRLHPWSHERRFLTAWDVDGRMWCGTGAPGMYATLKLMKGTRR